MVKRISLILILLGIIGILFVFGGVIKQEIEYYFTRSSGVRYSDTAKDIWTFERTIGPPNLDFAIVIPKINATAAIVDNVNPYNSAEYLKALKDGVAHAAGTPNPGETGNVYLFAHSTDAFYNVGRYNAVFFLLGHLNPGDEVHIYYKGRKFKYVVYDKKVVSATDSQYLGTLIPDEKTLTLQTCYPPGTTIKRLVVLAKMAK